jgi:mRNA interferase MazF
VNRGDLVTIALSGEFGKPRPALIIQSDQFDQTGTVTVLLVSGTLVDAPDPRRSIRLGQWFEEAVAGHGGQGHVGEPRQDRATIGHLDAEAMLPVTRALAVFFVIA